MAAISAEALYYHCIVMYTAGLQSSQVDEATDGGWHQGATAAVI